MKAIENNPIKVKSQFSKKQEAKKKNLTSKEENQKNKSKRVLEKFQNSLSEEEEFNVYKPEVYNSRQVPKRAE